MTFNEIIAQAKAERRVVLTEIESKQLIKAIGIPVVEGYLARSKEEAVGFSTQIGYPVVLKVISPDIIHKSDAGGVKLGLKDAQQVSTAYTDITAAIRQQCPQARLAGISVQRMATPGIEVIVGMSKDAQFGPLLMFGLGGVFVEVLKDVAFRIVPLTPKDAAAMIREVRGYPLLTGYRGQAPVDTDKLADIILKVSDFADKNPLVKELDLNPIFAYNNDAVAVDARVVLEDFR
jgi:acetyl-CoA synthetase (ADP-forming)